MQLQRDYIRQRNQASVLKRKFSDVASESEDGGSSPDEDGQQEGIESKDFWIGLDGFIYEKTEGVKKYSKGKKKITKKKRLTTREKEREKEKEAEKEKNKERSKEGWGKDFKSTKWMQ